jgi:hypothetical protein
LPNGISRKGTCIHRETYPVVAETIPIIVMKMPINLNASPVVSLLYLIFDPKAFKFLNIL